MKHTRNARDASPQPADKLMALLNAGPEPAQDGLVLVMIAAGRSCLHKLQRLGPMVFHVGPQSGNELQEGGRFS